MNKLKDIAEIQPGYVFRSGIEEKPDGNVAVVQIKDISPAGVTDAGTLVRTNIGDAKPEQFVRAGDVLFGSRGTRKPVGMVTHELPGTVFTYQIYAIRSGPTVIPEFLVWYLNQQPALQFIEENARGSYVTAISRKDLGEMRMPVPSLEVQRQVAEIQALARREADLLERLKTARNELADRVAWKLLRQTEKD